MTTSIADGLSGIVPAARCYLLLRTPSMLLTRDAHGRSGSRRRQQVAGVMRWASENGVTVFPWGGGTKLALGNLPDGVGLVLDMSRLNRVIDYQPGDLTVTVEAGITLDALQQELAAARQFVPLESPLLGRATVGGCFPPPASVPWPTHTGRPATGSSASASSERMARRPSPEAGWSRTSRDTT